MKKIIYSILLMFFASSVLASTGLASSSIIKAKYELKSFIEDVSDEHTFTGCYEKESELKDAVLATISVLEEMEELVAKYDAVEANVRKVSGMATESYIIGTINREYDKLDIENNALIVKNAEASIQIEESVKKYDKCQAQEQETYDELLEEYQGYLTTKKYPQALSVLYKAKTLVYSSTKSYKYIEDSIKYIKALQASEQSQKVVVESKKTPTQKTPTPILSDADVLANAGIVTKQDAQEKYNLQSLVLRQEVIGMAIKLADITPPTEYTCKNTFRDVSAMKPNNWVCRAVEIGVERGIVSGANKNFNPESNITRAEALAILMNASGIKVQDSAVSKYADVTVPWQINIVNTALSYGFIDATMNFYPNQNATRGEIFDMAKKILESKS